MDDQWYNFNEDMNSLTNNKHFYKEWYIRDNDNIRIGDRVFLVLIKRDYIGIIGSGSLSSYSYEKNEQVYRNTSPNKINIDFDILINYRRHRSLVLNELHLYAKKDFNWRSNIGHDIIIETEEFKNLLDGNLWLSRSSNIILHEMDSNTIITPENHLLLYSGSIIPPEIALKLEKKWFNLLNSGWGLELDFSWDRSDSRVLTMFENQYERNPYARKVSQEKKGQSCYVCGITFTEIGELSCSEIMEYHQDQEYLNFDDDTFGYPEDDLYPVCPNCHAMIHSRSYPDSIEELRQLIAGNMNCFK
jgi:5-methylcytosine-specific restriction protein A